LATLNGAAFPQVNLDGNGDQIRALLAHADPLA
jgi:hypothetical protein